MAAKLMTLPRALKSALALAVFAASSGYAQDFRQFEVASIRPTPPDTTEISCRLASRVDSVRLSRHCATLAGLIAWAWDLQGIRIEGGPGWAASFDNRYDIEAKAESAVTPEQMRLMTQALLAGRFQLKVHREKPVRPVFALVVVKGGAKLVANEAGTEPHGQVHFAMDGKTRILTGVAAPMSELIAWLKSLAPERPIIDATGLSGSYDFVLKWLPEDDQPTVALFTAIQDQLGLKVEDRKAPVDILIIDHAEKPMANQ